MPPTSISDIGAAILWESFDNVNNLRNTSGKERLSERRRTILVSDCARIFIVGKMALYQGCVGRRAWPVETFFVHSTGRS